MRVVGAMLLCLTACGADVTVSDDAQVSCADDADCVGGRVCARGIAQCVRTTAEDTVVAALSGVTVKGTYQLEVTFSAPVSGSATVPTSYAIVPAVDVQDAVLDAERRVARLVILGGAPGVTHVLSAPGVRDIFDRPLLAPAEAAFVAVGLTPDASPPEAITPASGSRVHALSTELTWSERTGAQQYTIEVTSADTGTVVVSTTSALARATVMLPGEGSYTWRVRADVTTADAFSTPSSLDVVIDTIHVYCPPGTSCDDPASTGSRLHPHRRIDRAFDDAGVLGAKNIHVASRGAEAYHETLVMPAGRNLLGGYDASFSNRDPAMLPTHVLGASLATLFVVGINEQTLVSGFVLSNELVVDQSSAGGVGASVVALANAGPAVELRDNVIQGTMYSHGITVNGDDPDDGPLIADSAIYGIGMQQTVIGYSGHARLENNHIESLGTVAGLFLQGNGSFEATGNDITGHGTFGSGINDLAISIRGQRPISLRYNNIHGAVLLRGGAHELDGNHIDAPLSGFALSIWAGGSALVRNNVVIAGANAIAAVVVFRVDVGAATGDARLIHNVFRAPAPSAFANYAVVAIRQDPNNVACTGVPTPLGSLDNNILIGTDAAPRGIAVGSNCRLPRSVQANAFVGISTALTTSLVHATVADLHNELCTRSCAHGGNIAIANESTLALDPITYAPTASTPSSVTQGAIDATQSTCGLTTACVAPSTGKTGPGACSGDGLDFTGAARGAPFSIGAYEVTP